MNIRIYQEGSGSTVTHDGKEYQLDVLFQLTHGREIEVINIDELLWVLTHIDLDPDRVKRASLLYPILVYNDPTYGWTVLDGAHRLLKAVNTHRKTIQAIVVTDDDLKKARVIEKKKQLFKRW